MSTADGALSIIDEKLIRMRQLAVQASNGALTESDRSFINVEFQQMKSEITRIAKVTNYNGVKLLEGDSSTFSDPTSGNYVKWTQNGDDMNFVSDRLLIGYDSDGESYSTIKFHIGANNISGQDYYYINLAGATARALGITNSDVLNTASAQQSINQIDSAINSKDTTRAFIGAMVNRLQSNILELQISRENSQASESMIRDTDVADEMSEFTRAQILFNTGISMLSQANSIPQSVASLIG